MLRTTAASFRSFVESPPQPRNMVRVRKIWLGLGLWLGLDLVAGASYERSRAFCAKLLSF